MVHLLHDQVAVVLLLSRWQCANQILRPILRFVGRIALQGLPEPRAQFFGILKRRGAVNALRICGRDRRRGRRQWDR
ncbi:hypothetical protein D9M68_987240 [compost metagenome]